MKFTDHNLIVTYASDGSQMQVLVPIGQPVAAALVAVRGYSGAAWVQQAVVLGTALERLCGRKATASGAMTPEQTEQCEVVWKLYPQCHRKVAKPKGIQAIRKAIVKSGFDVVHTAAYGYRDAVDKWSAEDMQFVPMPSTFYGQERYMDDPATWVRRPAKGARLEPDHDKGF